MQYHITPSFDDVKGGHIPNYVMPLWFENARRPLWQKMTVLGAPNTNFGTVRHASYDYRREVLGGEEVTIETRIDSIGNSSVVCHQEAWQLGQLAIVSETVLVSVNIISRTKAEIAPEARTYVESLCRAGR